MQEQSTSQLLMIRPINFGFNQETAGSNKFQKTESLEEKNLNAAAQKSFDDLVGKLRAKGIDVKVFDDTPETFTPDSIFPNNWISTHHSGKIILYPMEAPNRRLERRRDIVDFLEKNYDFQVLLDFSHHEKDSKYLEGTGSLVLDRTHKLAYACISTRTHPDVLKTWAEVSGYEPVTFHGFDQKGAPIYHTNVMMAMGDEFCVICLDSIKDPKEKNFVKEKIESKGQTIIDISFDQMNAFAGNMLMVKNKEGKNFLVMSERAYNSLDADQIKNLEIFAEIIYADLSPIEDAGGGSARCMIAEIHLPLK